MSGAATALIRETCRNRHKARILRNARYFEEILRKAIPIGLKSSVGGEKNEHGNFPIAHYVHIWRSRLGAADLKIGSSMAIGTVKWFNGDKGYGFIQPDDSGKDVFVHISAVEQAGLRGLSEGQKLQYDIKPDRGKEAAVNLQAI